ncbi:TerD family protein [Paenibacillus massiliensis]|uniref:TerD family protein n=1 Tax=Paenibacillus massiliensis TaxID=225917 RepID=UPI0004709520|nr:TerD family protein [Paenibacillus massiliensis]
MNNNDILLRRQRKWAVQSGRHELPLPYIATALKNIEQLGFTCSPALIKVLSTLTPAAFVKEYKQLVRQLKTLVGANVTYTPLFPRFPTDLIEEGYAKLYVHNLMHYFGLAMPERERTARPTLIDHPELKVIELGHQEDLSYLISQLIQAGTSISATDREDIEQVIASTEDISSLLPAHIPHKENASFVVAMLLRHGKASPEQIAPYFKTATDILRLAVALSDGDISLAQNTRFRKFKRSERRLLLALLEQCLGITEDMLRYKEPWIRLGEILHPSEYKQRYPQSFAAFDLLRNNRPYATFGSKVELALRWQQTDDALLLLAERPGELARRLDHLLRTHPEPYFVTELFGDVIDQISTPTLLQLITHFTHRNDERAWRTFFPKGNTAKAYTVPNLLPKLDTTLCATLIHLIRQALLDRFAELPSLGKVYIDEQLRQHMVPFSQRSASKSLRTLVRGSRVSLPEGNTVRFFLWWKEGFVNGKPTGRVDIDLSATLFDTDWNYMDHISYTHLSSRKFNAAHSGDVVTAPNGACEFIDLDIESVIGNGGRYVLTSLHSFNSQPYCDLPECYAGWMMRKRPGSGEVFEPSTVLDKVDMTSDTQIAVPVILDLVERTVIWCDLTFTRDVSHRNNLEGHLSGLALTGYTMANLRKPNLYDLFLLHAEARGQLVAAPEEADLVFSVHSGITPFDLETIMAQYIA